MGDRALEDASTVLGAVVRSDDMVARLGGDEFVIVVGLGDTQRLSEVVERLKRQIDTFNQGSGRPYTLALSIGSGIFDPRLSADATSFIARLDALMYEDKERKKADRAGIAGT